LVEQAENDSELEDIEIEAYGDAVCPQIAALVLMMIQMFDTQ
jgi:hypothetical protein